jgi:beta-aspartyl-peptidase (threonine type)
MSPPRPRYALAIHGGAGTLRRADMSPEVESAYRQALASALAAGEAVLAQGGRALDAVEAAVVAMEESPLFNAGHGAVFTATGGHELDASVMDGATRAAGAVAALTRVRNPVRLARLVLERSPHVMLAGAGAEAFAEAHGAERVDPGYFSTERRRRELAIVQAREGGLALSEDSSLGVFVPAAAGPGTAPRVPLEDTPPKFGTVGAVALDAHGHLAAATSTGGMTNKRWGRVGDSPIIGAGTFADDATCAVSATGHGEIFIRACAAADVAARIEYLGEDAATAARSVVFGRLAALGGAGGLIVAGRDGTLALPFNTEGMYRAWVRAGEPATIAIYADG